MAINYDEYKNKYKDQIEKNRVKWSIESRQKASIENMKQGLQRAQEKTKQNEDKSWFQKIFQTPKAFKDGYDFGDVTKTVLGTAADVGMNAVEGTVWVGEQIGKGVASAGAQVGDWLGQDEWAEKVRNRVAGKEETAFGTKGAPISSWLNSAQSKVDKYSISGESGDTIASLVGFTGGLSAGSKALGKLASIPISIGGKTLSVPTLAVATGIGSGFEEAYQKENVTDIEAWGKALGTGAIEGLTEGLFGVFGVGGSSLDDALAKGITSKFTKGASKVLANTLVKASGESVEEFLAYAGGQGLDWLLDKAFQDGADFYEKWDWEEVGEQMGMAFISSGIAQGGGSVFQISQQTAIAVDTAEQELGRPLTADEKANIKEQVTNQILELQDDIGTAVQVQDEVQKVSGEIQEEQEEIAPTPQEEAPIVQNQEIINLSNQIEELENQLSSNQNAVQQQEILNQIRLLENQIKAMQQGGTQEIAPVKIASTEAINEDMLPIKSASVEQISQPTTQEVQSNLATEVESNTQEVPKNQKNSKEMTLYHGTDEIFDEYDIEKFGKHDKGDLGKAIYFAKNKNTAQKYGENVKEESVLLDNPLVLNNAEDYKKMRREVVKDMDTSRLDEIELEMYNDEYTPQWEKDYLIYKNLTPEEKTEAVKKMGYDGIIDNDYGQVAVFDAKKIKKQKKSPKATKKEQKTDRKTPTQEELDNLEYIRKNKSGSEYASAYYDLEKKYGTGLYKGLNEYKSTGKALAEEIAPVKEELSELASDLKDTIKDTKKELKALTKELNDVKSSVSEVQEEFKALTEQDLPFIEQQASENLRTATEDIAPVMEDTTPEDEMTATRDLFAIRDYAEVGKRNINAYQYDHPEVRPYFQDAARGMLSDLAMSIKGEKYIDAQVLYDTKGEAGVYGHKRMTTPDIAAMLDGLDGKYKMSYADIEKGLEAIIEDKGSENIAASKRVEFYLDQRLRDGYVTIEGHEVGPNQEYINLMSGIEATNYYNELPFDDIAPVDENRETYYNTADEVGISGNDSTFITVAPYYNTELTNENFDDIKNAVDTEFKNKAHKFASLFNARIENISTNIGGFTFQEGENAGQFVKELSYTFELKNTSTSEADIIASLLGDLGHEQQEAVISANYLDKNSNNADALEFRVGVKNADGVDNVLRKAGIDDYTIDTTNNTIKILEFDIENPSNIIDKLKTLRIELGGNYNGIEESKIQSRYLDREARQGIYQEWLGTNETNQSNGELSNYISEALQKIQGSTQQTNQELDNSSFFNEEIAPVGNQYEAIAPTREDFDNGGPMIRVSPEMENRTLNKPTETKKVDWNSLEDTSGGEQQYLLIKKLGSTLTDTSLRAEQRVADEQAEKFGMEAEEQNNAETITQILTEKPERVQGKWDNFNRLRKLGTIKLIQKDYYLNKLARESKNQSLSEDSNNLRHAGRISSQIAIDGIQEWKIDRTKKRSDKGRLTSTQKAQGIDQIYEPIENKGLTHEFDDYAYNLHNIDRMSIESKAQEKMTNLKNTTLKGYSVSQIEQMARGIEPNEQQLGFDLKFDEQDIQKVIEASKEYVKLGKERNKTVFGEQITAKVSQENIKKYDEHKESFEQASQEITRLNDALLDFDIESGRLTAEDKAFIKERYPNYVPVYYKIDEVVKSGKKFKTKDIRIKEALDVAEGGSSEILPLKDAMQIKVRQKVAQNLMNKLGLNIMHTFEKQGKLNVLSTESVDAMERYAQSNEQLLSEMQNGGYALTVYENGNKIMFEVPMEVYEALKPSDIPVVDTLNTLVDIKRSLLTEYNLYFATRNIIRDMPTAFLQSQNSLQWLKNVPEAVRQVATKGQYYQLAQTLGAGNNDYANMNQRHFADIGPTNANEIQRQQEYQGNKFKTGWEAFKNWKGVKWISDINGFMEQIPRMAEFITSIDTSVQNDINPLTGGKYTYAQDEVTVNFGKGGDLVKTSDRNVTNFMNASIQGTMKLVDTFRDAYAYKGAKGLANTIMKYGLAGASMIALMNWAWDDDEDYEELSDYVKNNYYILGKYDDGKFIKIPKGRTNAVIESIMNNGLMIMSGERGVKEALEDTMSVIENNIAPTTFSEANLFSTLTQIYTNTSWYGEDLVPTRLQDLPAEEQYDETTDVFSIWLGQKLGISPYKINYFLNQSSGFVGDMVLPLMTTQAETPIDNDLAEMFLGQFYKDYTTDSVMKNQNVTDFFELVDELSVASKGKDATDEDILKYKYISTVQAQMNELYAEKREIQNNKDLTDSEKLEALREAQIEIDNLAKTGLDQYDKGHYDTNYAVIGDVQYQLKENEDGELYWSKVSDDEAEELEALGFTNAQYDEYFALRKEFTEENNDYYDEKDRLEELYGENSEEYDAAVDELYMAKKTKIIDTIMNANFSDEQKGYLYKKYYNTDTVDTILSAGIDIDYFLDYEKHEFKADYNGKGKAIANSRKNKVINYINSYDLSVPEKAILIKSTNTFKFNDYNNAIVDYVSNLDIGYEDKVYILQELDMVVSGDGTVTWK
jgi:hypothetical protein